MKGKHSTITSPEVTTPFTDATPHTCTPTVPHYWSAGM